MAETPKSLVQFNGLLAAGGRSERKQAWADAYRHTPHREPFRP